MVLGFQYRTAERYFRYFTSMSECQSDSTYNLNCTVVADIGDDMLWQILRVNEDGSIRLIYHTPILEDFDVPNGIGSVYYNELNGDNAYNGYMYGMTGIEEEISSPMCLTYDSINNKAIDSTTTYSTKELCENSNGKWVTTAYQATHASVVDSTIKKYIDGWYETYLKDNLDGYLVDAGFCNDRGVASNPGVWTSADTAKGYGTNTTYYASRLRLNYTTELTEKVRFKCKNKNDLFSTNLSNGNGSLTYPIGIITTDEVVYSGINRNEREDNNNFLIIDEDYWTMTPYLFYEDNFIFATVKDGAYLKTIVGNGTERTARPVINIDKNSIITNLNQNGTINNPYEIKLEEQ